VWFYSHLISLARHFIFRFLECYKFFKTWESLKMHQKTNFLLHRVIIEVDVSRSQCNVSLSNALDPIKSIVATPNVANPNIEIASDIFFQLKVNKKTWFLHNKMFFPWSIFVVNSRTKIFHGTTQIMRCTICHCVFKVYNFNNNTKKKD
jgi:hypothetical protein